MSTIALVIGGASGIGEASVRALADAGHSVAIADIRLETAKDLAADLPNSGHRAFGADAANEAELVDLFDQLEADMGPVGILIIAAGSTGYIDGQRPSLRTMPVDAWDKVMALNVRGPMICIREMLNRRAERPVSNGRIVLVGSMAAQALAINSPPSYVASKGALHALARSAAGEAAALGITVNTVAPGAIDTPMLRSVMPKDRDESYFGATVAGRAGSATEVAQAIAFLAKPEASYINGAVIDVNGGLLMR